jgi:hypothetical protein
VFAGKINKDKHKKEQEEQRKQQQGSILAASPSFKVAEKGAGVSLGGFSPKRKTVSGSPTKPPAL